MSRSSAPAIVGRVVLIGILFAFMIAGCRSFPPSRELPADAQSAPFKAPPMLPTPTIPMLGDEQATQQSAQAANCTNDLLFLEDLTIPDGTQVNPGTVMSKEWKVKNSGTCNWNETYSIRLVSGESLGALSPQSLIPARNGAEATISITITAPSDPGKYSGTWRAFDSNDQPFGEWFSVEITVINP